MIHVVCGPPCAGKSTFVDKNAPPGAVKVDLDRIAVALGSSDGYDHGRDVFEAALAARDAAIESAKRHGSDAWVIHTAPTDTQLSEWESLGAEVHVLDPGRNEALQRAKRDGRPDATTDAINKWYEKSNQAAYERLFSYLAPHGATAQPRPHGQRRGPHGPGSEDGMSDTDATTAAAETTPQEQPATDWQAESAKWQAESRKWEERSKANRDKAKAYDALSDEHEALKAERDKAAERIAELEKQLGAATAAKARDEAIAAAAAAHKVDPEILAMTAGDTPEEIEANAAKLAERLGTVRLYPQVGDQGAAKPAGMSRESIAKLKGRAQLDAIRENISLYK